MKHKKIRDKKLLDKYIKDNPKCENPQCRKASFEIHHILKNHFRTDEIWNIVAICSTCHKDSHYEKFKTPIEYRIKIIDWLRYKFYYKNELTIDDVNVIEAILIKKSDINIFKNEIKVILNEHPDYMNWLKIFYELGRKLERETLDYHLITKFYRNGQTPNQAYFNYMKDKYIK